MLNSGAPFGYALARPQDGLRDAITAAVEARVDTGDFYKPAHGHVFAAIWSLYEQGEPVDPVTVAEELRLLPTGGSARFFSPLGTYDFLKRTTIIQAQKKALKSLAADITHLARLEGLDDHARAVEARFAD